MREIFETAYITNLLLCCGVYLLYRITRLLTAISQERRRMEHLAIMATMTKDHMENIENIATRLALSHERSNESLYEIKALQEAIIRYMPGSRRD